MTEPEKKILKRLFIVMAGYYGQPIPDESIVMYVEDLSDLALNEVQVAMMALRRDPKTRRCPLPADIRQKIAGPQSDDAVAVEVSARILTAISRFGHTNRERARIYIGEVGWEVVTMQGGWDEVCRYTGVDMPIGVAQAQWRQLAVVAIDRSRRGMNEDTGPALPAPTGRPAIDVGRLLPRMPGKED